MQALTIDMPPDIYELLFANARFVGKLVGRYYDDKGNPTKYLKGVEAKARRGAQLLEKQKIEEAKIPSCNSRWSEQDGGKVENASKLISINFHVIYLL